MRSKRVLKILGIVTVLCAATFVIVKNFCANNQKTSPVNEKPSISEYVTNRACISEGKQVKVGNNEKELQNGYYDILLETDEPALKMYINKLWKTEFKDKLYESEYVNQVSDYFIANTNCNLNKEEIAEIITKGYVAAKNGETYYKKVEHKGNVITFQSNCYELVIEVKSI